MNYDGELIADGELISVNIYIFFIIEAIDGNSKTITTPTKII